MYKQNLQFNIIFRPEPEGGFTVIVPSLPGCVTYGETLENAKKMAIDAIIGYIASLRKHNEPIPASDEQSFISTVSITDNKKINYA
ncbi:MAG: type II toxin-antitoxin system HicB family antitoxin [bacterium]